MPIDAKVVQQVAVLARLQVESSEEARLVKELTSILSYVEQLQDLDVSGIEPTSQVGEGTKAPLREDEVKPSNVRDEALAQAPDRDGDYFRVPQVV
ncbi:MAG: Asp-tRNA(Asn)/Glu-tRNA(Gln) amidotransferase subunit GatC [Candidatus Eisenbacteria bacterium]|uniref:Aspartyl/glutamyl-tRNA(Asn/Gln) amidotransferase subunit C n=1 Tax=Eiseniibacteriota bacterium TaxID=2212470 RepID=A0A538SC14_UNCEI|nr:MAG: Asp-tRNA(Asn)/Glu-tRNA(Gln) amidotransferase subunit GatC [Candidatus Eisenbacteria bacterium]TMQ61448.1 MAG: Asp-tRNA(Asn)/Glu-tRNA(Gln) amidotransferase subunit GatC [Candidatus Eisenbacteria bacterium]